MIVITENKEDKKYYYKEWYKKMEELIGTQFDTTSDFENSLSIGQEIICGEEPLLPSGMTIAKTSTATLGDLRAKTLVILEILQTDNTKKIYVGIHST